MDADMKWNEYDLTQPRLYAPPSADLKRLVKENRKDVFDEPQSGVSTYRGSIGYDMLTVKLANDEDEFWEATLKLKQEG